MVQHGERPLQGKKAVMLVGPLFEDVEATYPYYRLQEEGIEVTVAGSEAGAPVTGKKGESFTTELAAKDAKASDFDICVLPGGFGPDKLRTDEGVRRLVREMHEEGKPVAFICHAGWIPISADILDGRRATSVGAIADDMRNAGCLWEDAEVVVDGNLVSSRTPPDLPAFMSALIAVASKQPSGV